MQYFPWPPEDELPEPLAGGIRLRYVPADPLGPGGMGAANLSAALQYTRNRYGPSSGMMVRLYTSSPRAGKGNAVVSGTGYTRGGQSPAHVRPVTMSQQPSPGPFPHPATCSCIACAPVMPSVPGCTCPVCVPVPPLPGLNCTCPSCTASRSRYYAPGGIVPSPPAPSASQPPSYIPVTRPKSRPFRGMDGFDGAPLVAGTASGYRWWTIRAPQLHRDPGDAGKDWDPGLLRGQKDVWQPGVNQARCLPPGGGMGHGYGEVPHSDCGCGYWAYWEIQQHDLGGVNSLPVVGVVRASGQVIMGPRGFRAQKAEIIALHLPFRIEPDRSAILPAIPPDDDPVTRMFATRQNWRAGPRRPSGRFTGRVISFPGAPPVPPSLGGPPSSYAPPMLPDPPPEPEPPGEEEIRAARDRAMAWMAVIEDRLQFMYPGAEVCASLDLMTAKYPVTSEYVPPEEQVRQISCPYCAEPCEKNDIHTHIAKNHCL